VIVSPNAGAANELVRDGENGFVCELDVSLWADRAAELLTQPEKYSQFSQQSLRIVSEYTFDHAASGLIDACLFAASKGRPRQGETASDSEKQSMPGKKSPSKYCWSQIS